MSLSTHNRSFRGRVFPGNHLHWSDPDRYQHLNTLVLGPHRRIQQISSKSVHNLLTYTAKWQFTPYLLMVNNPRKWSRIHRRIQIATKI